jgi:hypothetical protein
MLVCFSLTMPSAPSWNGKWSGEDRLWAVIRSLRDIPAELIGSHTYRWSDGWCACVRVREVSKSDAAQIRKKSAGFCGYEWMIDSLLRYGKILADHEVKALQEQPTA